MKKIFAWLLVIGYWLLVTPTYAVCPICTLGVGAGLGLARFLGVDDTVSGVWIGGLILSSSFWLADWLKKKDFSFVPKFLTSHFSLLTSFFMYLLVILPLWFAKIIGHPFNTLFGIDKLIFGLISGSLAFLLALLLDQKIRKIRGRQLFYWQKIVFPFSFLAILSIVFYLTVK